MEMRTRGRGKSEDGRERHNERSKVKEGKRKGNRKTRQEGKKLREGRDEGMGRK